MSRRVGWILLPVASSGSLFIRLPTGGITVFVTTHFMDEAEYCDRIGLVYHGKLIASGTPGRAEGPGGGRQPDGPNHGAGVYYPD